MTLKRWRFTVTVHWIITSFKEKGARTSFPWTINNLLRFKYLWYELMISTQWLRLHAKAEPVLSRISATLFWHAWTETYCTLKSHFHECLLLPWGIVICAVPTLGKMACLWVVLEAHKSAWSSQELKLKLVTAIQSMHATNQAFRGNRNHFKNYSLWEDHVMCRLTWIHGCLARNSSHLKGLLAEKYANSLPFSQPEGEALLMPIVRRIFSSNVLHWI